VASALAAAIGPGPARADDAELLDRIRALEDRIVELESSRGGEGSSARSDWTERVRLSGSANVGFYGGESDSVTPIDAFQVRDARFFVEADLAHDVQVGGQTLVRDVGFLFEWNLVRLGELENDVGELYVDFQHLFGSTWLSFQVGRFQIPVGENYLRFAQGFYKNPFISNTVGGPWWWDEGIRIYGNDREHRFGYVASVSNGETPFNDDPNQERQFSLKLYTNPTRWLHLSVSALRSGNMGSSVANASGALWLGESWARAYGSNTNVPNVVNRAVVPDGPSELTGSTLVAGDAILSFPDIGRLWLGYGRYDIRSKGSGIYDRGLRYWIAELVLEGALVSPLLRPFYVGLRANGLDSSERGEGYRLDARYAGSLGYDIESIEDYSLALGWRLNDLVTLKAEYTLEDVDVVPGLPRPIRQASERPDRVGVEVGVHF
jgi:hypothetical protein